MEKVNYEEAREWFWVRTVVWCVPAAIVSVIVCFGYYGSLISEFGDRMLYSAIAGVGATLLGLLAAFISIQFTWMRMGWKLSWPLNSLVCAGVAALGALLISAVILCVMGDNIYNPASEQFKSAVYGMMQFAIGLAVFWGLTLGGWFALRFDKYFVEFI